MGWIGVATLIATTCFLFYRHPPTSWFPESSTKRAGTESSPEEKTSNRATGGEGKLPTLETQSQPLKEEDDNAEESRTTPRATASDVPVLDVPSFQLNGDKADNSTAAQKVHQNTYKIPNKSEIQPSTFLTPTNTITKTDPRSSPHPPVTIDASVIMPPPPPPSRLRPTPSQKQQQSLLSPTAGRYSPQLGDKSGSSSTLSPPPSAAASLRVPAGSRLTSNNLAPTPLTLKPAKKASQRAVLEPGYSPLDWAALTLNPNHKLRGANLPSTLIRVTPSMLKAQNGRKGTDAWTSYQGKVYNITPYLPFHPGGKGELLRGAGKDSGKLFLEIHPWVNWDAILGECLVGILVSENEHLLENQLDAMD